MKAARLKRRRFDDSSASSDVAFLLIIYFIVIAAFNINKGFLMNLPTKDSARLILKEDLMRYELDESGALFYMGEATDFNAAEIEIRAAVAGHPNLAVVLTVAPDAPWQQVVSFVELAQRLEVEAFSFTMSGADSGG